MWLDCAVGSLGAAAVLAVVLSPVLDSALTGSLSLATVVAVAYPMFDLLLVAAVAGIAALRGMRMGRRWAAARGARGFFGADVFYPVLVIAETNPAGSAGRWLLAGGPGPPWVGGGGPGERPPGSPAGGASGPRGGAGGGGAGGPAAGPGGGVLRGGRPPRPPGWGPGGGGGGGGGGRSRGCQIVCVSGPS